MPTKIDPVVWMKGIEKLQGEGYVICPLMTEEPGHYKPESCLCHIPKTRELFHSKTPELPCDTGNHCLVSVILPEETEQESRLLKVG